MSSIFTFEGDGSYRRATFATVGRRAEQLVLALAWLGVKRRRSHQQGC